MLHLTLEKQVAKTTWFCVCMSLSFLGRVLGYRETCFVGRVLGYRETCFVGRVLGYRETCFVGRVLGYREKCFMFQECYVRMFKQCQSGVGESVMCAVGLKLSVWWGCGWENADGIELASDGPEMKMWFERIPCVYFYLTTSVTQTR